MKCFQYVKISEKNQGAKPLFLNKLCCFNIFGTFFISIFIAAFISDVLEAQQFLAPTVVTNHYGYLSESTVVVWAYTTPNISKTRVDCEVNLVNAIFKRAGAAAVIERAILGRATVIDDTKTSPYRIGFKLRNITFSDASDYYCSMSYDGGPLRRSRIYRLIVYVAPVVKRHLPNRTIVITNTQASWTCEFATRPAASVTWYFNGKDVVSSSKYSIKTMIIGVVRNVTTTSTTLTINLIQLKDSGILKCEGSIPNNVISSSTTITVLYPPKVVSFISSKANGIAVVGEAVEFTYNTTSLPLPSYELRHNNVLITNSTNQVYKITNASLADEGMYTCVAYNYLGYSAMSSVNLTIHVPPSLNSHSSESIVIQQNTPYSLYCTFSGKPAPQITWYKMEGNSFKIITSISKVLITNTSVSMLEKRVVFKNVKRFDGGIYRCSAVNAAGKDAKNFTLNVTYSAIATSAFRQNHTIVENPSNSVTWLCKLESNPPGRIKWYLEGKLLPSHGFKTVEKVLSNKLTGMVLESKLTMIGVRREKAGALVCNASNSIGFDIKKTVIIINYPPNNVSMISERYVKPDRTRFEIFCTFDANPAAKIAWKYNKTNVDSRNIKVTEIVLSSNVYNTRKRSFLRIDVVEKHMQGGYQCIATNLLGSATLQTQLIVQFQPVTEWSQWGQCNITCGDGYQSRTRSCKYRHCGNTALTNFRNCTGKCGTSFIVISVLIPILVLFFSLCLVWLYRKKRRSLHQTPAFIPVQEDLSTPQSRGIIQGNGSDNFSDSNFGTINRVYMDDKINDNIKLNDENTMKANVIPTINEVGYEDIEAEVRFDVDSLKYSSTAEGFRHHERASPSPFSNEEYLRILPFADSRWSSGGSSTEDLISHEHGLENVTITTSF